MRYIRQEILIGKKKQKLIEEAKISVIGLGALGSVVSELLVRAGVKNLILVDRDVIELNNLQRQSLYTEKDVGDLKAVTAERKLKEINSEVNIKAYAVDLDYENIDLIKSDLILDCTDNFETRFLINEYSVKKKISWIYASVIGSKGMTYNIIPGKACFRCLFKEPNENLGSCETAGILNTIVHVIAGIQVTEAIKVITKQKPRESLLHYEILNNKTLEIKVNRSRDCNACNNRFEYLNGKNIKDVIKMCGSSVYQIKSKNLDLKELNDKFKKFGNSELTEHCLFFNNMTIFSSGRVLIKAKTKEEAKSQFDKYLG